MNVPNPLEWPEIGVKYARLAIWAPDPLTQIAVNFVIIVAAMLSTSVGFAPGIVIAMVAMFFIAVGIVRILIETLFR